MVSDKNSIAQTRVDLKNRSYDIKIGYNLLKKSGEILLPIVNGRRIFIISDENVAPKYLDILEESLEAAEIEHASFILPAGEKTKGFFWLEKICETLLKGRIDRSSIIIALGGGVVGDISGFAASIVLRGVDFIQIPTTLLAQVDSSVGGKTAINVDYGKNLIGSFYQPLIVLADVSTLKTLDKRQIKSGYAEIAKYGLIQDKNFWDYLKKNGEKIIKLKEKELNFAVLQSCKIKADVVSKDEKESSIRALLNFGHSFGHALEAIAGFDEKKLLHGEAVSIGMLIAAKLSENLGFISQDVFNEIKNHFEEMNLPTKISDIKDVFTDINSNQIAEFIERDKKNKNGKINLILLKEIGQAFIYSEAKTDDIKSAINYFM